MLNKIIEQIDYKLNSGFFPDDLDIKGDRFYSTGIYLTKLECLFLKNILEDTENILTDLQKEK